MNTPDPNADRARLFAAQFNAGEECAFRSRRRRELWHRLLPHLTEEELNALDAPADERDSDDVIGFFLPHR